jgi:WhiB family redox-sensing transcriptional regulator
LPDQEAQQTMETMWMARGSCANTPPGVFFPSDGVGVEIAKRICDGCRMTEPCLNYALEHRIDHGGWRGCSERQFRSILRRRRELAINAP